MGWDEGSAMTVRSQQRSRSRIERMIEKMAFDRKTFKDKLQDILGAALTHFYMVKLARLNSQTKWVQHWETELDRLVNMDAVRVLVSATKGRWDKERALAES